MAPEATQAEDAPGMSEVGRIAGIFYDPKRVFQDLAAKPRWLVPTILGMAFGLLYIFQFNRLVGWGTMLRQQMETNPRMQQLSAEQINQIVQQQEKFGPIMGYAFAVFGLPITLVIVAGVLLGVFRVLGSANELSFKQVFSVASYSFLPGCLFAILAMTVMALKEPADFDLQNPLMFNIGAFLDRLHTPAWLYSLASSVDAFTIWTILLIALGLSLMVRKMPFSRSVGYVISPWLVWVMLKAGGSAIFG